MKYRQKDWLLPDAGAGAISTLLADGGEELQMLRVSRYPCEKRCSDNVSDSVSPGLLESHEEIPKKASTLRGYRVTGRTVEINQHQPVTSISCDLPKPHELDRGHSDFESKFYQVYGELQFVQFG